MRNAYALLGLLFILLIGGTVFLVNKEEGEVTIPQTATMVSLTSTAFAQGGTIPSKYTCDGENRNPPLVISSAPEGTGSFALVMDDPDAVKPAGKVWDHWIIWNIPPDTRVIEEGKEPKGLHGKGTGGNLEYSGPCPPDAMHHYSFKLYALDAMLPLLEGATKGELEAAMEGHIIEQVELSGTYERQ